MGEQPVTRLLIDRNELASASGNASHIISLYSWALPGFFGGVTAGLVGEEETRKFAYELTSNPCKTVFTDRRTVFFKHYFCFWY
jgi:hypothetical protein